MSDDRPTIRATDIDGYDAVFGACADLIENSTHPPLAAATILNAACACFHATCGAERLEAALRAALAALPEAQAEAERDQRGREH